MYRAFSYCSLSLSAKLGLNYVNIVNEGTALGVLSRIVDVRMRNCADISLKKKSVKYMVNHDCDGQEITSLEKHRFSSKKI